MSYYELLVIIHLLGVTVWVGSELHLLFLQTRAHARGPEAEAVFAVDFVKWGNSVLAGAAFVAGVAGFLAVIEGPWEFSQAWVSIGMTVWILSFLSGAALLGPTGKRLQAALDEDGGTLTDRGTPLLARMLLVVRIEVVLLLVVVVVMVTKPGA